MGEIQKPHVLDETGGYDPKLFVKIKVILKWRTKGYFLTSIKSDRETIESEITSKFGLCGWDSYDYINGKYPLRVYNTRYEVCGQR